MSMRLVLGTLSSFVFLILFTQLSLADVRLVNVENEYIVVFRDYLPAEQHQALIKAELGPDGWSNIERHNSASIFPTDFLLLRIHQNRTDLIEILRKSSKIRHLIDHQRIDIELQSFEQSEQSETRHFNDSLGSFRSTLADKMENFDERTAPTISEQPSEQLRARILWEKGFRGQGIRVAVFDTGLSAKHPHFKNVKERTDWTDEGSADDRVGHGTFVAGVIGGQHPACTGMAPDASLYIFRVFTTKKISYTAWFLDAFNYAIHTKMDVLNLSIGGPDFTDLPFVEKVWELTSNGIIVVSAIGNEGPYFGTLNNPADMSDVIGVGGIDYDDRISAFSSRGMTTWELPAGYGRVKPDLVTLSYNVLGSAVEGTCRRLSGTSVASPIVAGAVAILLSSLPETIRREKGNSAAIKQALIESAIPIEDMTIFEQGAGKLSLIDAHHKLLSYSKPKASLFPSKLDLADCPMMWPFCKQPVYYSSLPLIVNVTILNSMGVYGTIRGPPVWVGGRNADLIEVGFEYSSVLWPWSGYVALFIRATEPKGDESEWTGLVDGQVRLAVITPAAPGEVQDRVTYLALPVRLNVIETPPRNRRILWDQYHSLRYPGGYFPNDVLWDKLKPFDWHGDHIHTNFRGLFHYLLRVGYFVEVLGENLNCFDATNYGTLLLVDSEDEYRPEEIIKLKKDVLDLGLSVLVVSDWYNTETIEQIRFYDDNTRKWWSPVTGGSNVPALNDLLEPFNISFGSAVFEGDFSIGRHKSFYASGSSIREFPAKGLLLGFDLTDQSAKLTKRKAFEGPVPVIGLASFSSGRMDEKNELIVGRMGVFGDSSCLDDLVTTRSCHWLLEKMLMSVAVVCAV